MGIGVAAGILVLAAAGWLVLNTRDAAPPDVSGLALDTAAVPEDDNAFPLLQRAAEASHLPTGCCCLATGDLPAGIIGDETTTVKIFASNKALFGLVQSAIQRPTCRVPPGTDFQALDLSMDRWERAGELLSLRAAFETGKRNVRGAMKSSENLVRFGDMTCSGAETIRTYLTGFTAIQRGLTHMRALAMEQDLTWDDLRGMERTLAAKVGISEGWTRAMKGEYRRIDNDIARVEAGLDSSAARYSFHPNRTRRMAAEMITGAMEMTLQDGRGVRPYDRAAKARLATRFSTMGQDGSAGKACLPNSRGKQLCAAALPAILEFHDSRYLAEILVSGTRLVLACKAYEKAQGKLLADLGALVPDFIDAVPADPIDGAPFRYSLEKRTVSSPGIESPVVFSLDSSEVTGAFMPKDADARPACPIHETAEHTVHTD